MNRERESRRLGRESDPPRRIAEPPRDQNVGTALKELRPPVLQANP
jgi:hypothetical protein